MTPEQLHEPDPLREGGTARPVTMYGEPVLHRACAEVTEFDDELVTLVRDMYQSMYAAKGVGLAANQVGVSLRVFVVDCPNADEEFVVAHVINPVLELPVERILDDNTEGCLSVPGPHATLPRSARANVRGVDVHGEPVFLEGTGLLARCLQHETDHLEGMVFVDRISAKERKRVLFEAFG